uniref:Uncharacterized protein n=1 Tax=Strombidium inclinatum TaxID=197538 RepID=A0A7S3IGY2_9SPIT
MAVVLLPGHFWGCQLDFGGGINLVQGVVIRVLRIALSQLIIPRVISVRALTLLVEDRLRLHTTLEVLDVSRRSLFGFGHHLMIQIRPLLDLLGDEPLRRVEHQAEGSWRWSRDVVANRCGLLDFLEGEQS